MPIQVKICNGKPEICFHDFVIIPKNDHNVKKEMHIFYRDGALLYPICDMLYVYSIINAVQMSHGILHT